MATRLFRIRRRNDAQLRYAFVKADSLEDAGKKFAAIAGTFIKGEPTEHHDTIRCNLGDDGSQIELHETTVDFITDCHPVLDKAGAR